MQKKHIIIASLLKPINDTRMFEKLGISISKVNGFEVKIVGFKGKIPQADGIRFFPLFQFDRLDIWNRFKAPFQFYTFLKKNPPDILIVGTHELLWPGYLFCLFNTCTFVYDVRENYFLNILRGKGFYSIFSPFLAWYVRCKEWITSHKVDLFLLAEGVYSEQLRFIKDRWIYLPNTVAETKPVSEKKDPFQLLFSGTIAYETGIFEAIQLAESFHAKDPRYHLMIIGFCPQKQVMKILEQRVKALPFIQIVGGTEMVDHTLILEAIQSSGYGIISYHNLPQFKGKIPTKVYEYLYYQLSVITIRNTEIKQLIGENGYYIENINDDVLTTIENQIIRHVKSSFPLTWSDTEEDLLTRLINL